MLFINIKVFDKVFINRKFVKFYKFFVILLQNLIKLCLANNKFVLNIIYVAQIIVNLSEYINIL